MTERKIQFVKEGFYNESRGFVLTSRSLGGMTPDEYVTAFNSDTARLVEQGIALPITVGTKSEINENCAFVLGDLTDEEEAEWIARVRGHLKIPDGEVLVVSGGGELEHYDDEEGTDSFMVAPGHYLVEVYAFVGSKIAQLMYGAEDLLNWWQASRGDEEPPFWLKFFLSEELDEDEWPDWMDSFKKELAKKNETALDHRYHPSDSLLNCIIRVMATDDPVPLPKLYHDGVAEFEKRDLELCPRGIPIPEREKDKEAQEKDKEASKKSWWQRFWS